MISYQSLPLQLADASIVVSLAGFTLIVAAGVQPRKIFRGRVLVYGKTMVIAVDPRSAGNYTPRPPSNRETRRFQTTGNDPWRSDRGTN